MLCERGADIVEHVGYRRCYGGDTCDERERNQRAQQCILDHVLPPFVIGQTLKLHVQLKRHVLHPTFPLRVIFRPEPDYLASANLRVFQRE